MSDIQQPEWHDFARDLVEQVELERFEFLVRSYLSKKMLASFFWRPEISIEPHLDGVMLEIRQVVFGEGPWKVPGAKYPMNWKEAVKSRFAPEGFKRRWPVRYHEVWFEARVVYPKISLPNEEHNIAAVCMHNVGLDKE